MKQRLVGYDIDGTLAVDRYPRIKRLAIRVKWGWLYRWCARRMTHYFRPVHEPGNLFVVITARNPHKMGVVTTKFLEEVFPGEVMLVRFLGLMLDFAKPWAKQVGRLKADAILEYGVTDYYEDEKEIARYIKRFAPRCRVHLVTDRWSSKEVKL
jgi:hypothetical protein